MRGADQPIAPAEAGAQQQLRVARDQLEDFHELDVENSRDGRSHFVEQFLQIGLGQRLFAEPRERFLLFGAGAQFAQQFLPVGDVAANAEQARRLAVLAVDDGRDRLQPAVFLVGARREPVCTW